MSALAEGALWAALGELLAFALLSRCQRHRQRGPWYYAEGPLPPTSPSLAGSRFSSGHPDGQYPTRAVSGWVCALDPCLRHPHMVPLHISRTTGRGIP